MRPDLEVDSGGTNVAIPIAEKVKEYLEKQNAKQYLKKTPESLYSKQLSEYDLIIAMEQRHKDYILSRCPRCNVVLWNIEDHISWMMKMLRKSTSRSKRKSET